MMSISGRFRPPTVRRNVLPPAENLSWQAAQGNTTSGAQGGRWFDEIVDADAAEDLSTSAPGSIEVHNRRYDTPAVYHRRTLSAVRIEAQPSLVWKVLTAYESLAKFAPNLVHCEVLPNATLGVAVPGGGVAGGTGKNLKRLRFVFLKHCLCHDIRIRRRGPVAKRRRRRNTVSRFEKSKKRWRFARQIFSRPSQRFNRRRR